jgi:endonuclease/exonuclease/phosphatase family metal-dependent hydrolase
MRLKSHVGRCAGRIFLLGAAFFSTLALAQSNINVRVVAANLNGNTQSYQPFAIRIFQGLKPDIVAIQEFNYSNNLASDFRSMVDTAFGTNFVYYREPYTDSGEIPNGIISRYPILAAGSWVDTVQSQPNRGFAWAQIDVPGTNDLYVISVHLLTSSASARSSEAANLKALIQANFPSNAWIVVAGDFNTDTRTESTTMTTFDSYLSDNPVPADNNGNSNTSQNRNHPHDYVLPNFSLANFETATVFPSHSFPNGLVFDSTVYTPLSGVPPVQFGDSTNAQHMAVMKDFLIPAGGNVTNPPAITAQPQSQTNFAGGNVSFSVTVTGTSPLGFQWVFNGTNISGATTNPFALANIQLTNAGNYSVIVTNVAGSVTSSNAVLAVTNAPPSITTQPQSQTVSLGDTTVLNATAIGTPPLNYQWRFNGTNISGANTNNYTLASIQLTNAGNYTVVITNFVGSATSGIAVLAVFTTQAVVIAQWNFNSVVSDGSTTTGTRAPSIGSGTNSYVVGAAANGSGEFASGSGSGDTNTTDNSAWNTSSYPSVSANNKTAGVQFNVSTANRQNIVITWASQASSSGSKYGRLQYTTNGTTFNDFPTCVTNPTAFTTKTNSLIGIPGVNNNSNFAFRLVSEYEATATGAGASNYVASGSYAGTGTIRFDMVTVSGTPATPPASAVLSSAAFAGSQFGFIVSGSVGANYIVQGSTNLASTNWIPLLTNTPPFSFGDTDIAAPQKFYRAVSQ